MNREFKTVTSFLAVSFFLVLVGCSSSNTTTDAANIVGTVGQDMVPASLAYSTTDASSVGVNAAPTSNPCEEYEAEYGASTAGRCQPKLISLYLEMVQEFMTMTQGFLQEFGEKLGDLQAGTGTVTREQTQITYNKTDNNNYRLLIAVNGVNAGYIDVAGSAITVKLAFESLGETEANALGNLEGVISYSDQNNYDVTVTLSGMPCRTEDVGAPRNIRVIVNKVNGLWKGYAMMYQPRWGGDNSGYTCDTTETENTSVVAYNNFVGNSVAAKVNAYIMRRTIDEATFRNSLGDYGLNRMCTNYPTPSIIGNDGCPHATRLSEFVNSFCNPANTLEAEWSSNCSSYDATVAATDFPTSSWMLPSEIYAIDGQFSIPSSL